MRSRADNIRAQADHAIYSDDEDAIERLRERIAGLEAERKRITDYNRSCRKAAKTGELGDLSLLDSKQQRQIATLSGLSHQVRSGGAFPAYATSNLSGNIGRLKKRLAGLEAKQGGEQ
jgi:hypothetical protein